MINKMIYKHTNIILIIIENMDQIKDKLIKYNKIYDNITTKEKLDNIINNISTDISNEYKINKDDVINTLTRYSYLISNNFIIDTNYKTNNDYDNLIKLFNTNKFLPFRHNNINHLFGPFGSQWIHDNQIDDDIKRPEIIRRRLQFEKLNSIKYPTQRSPEWFAQRDGKITASDAGVVIGENKYEQPYKMIVKKVRETFQNNEATYHGKKYEDIAKLIYEYRMNVIVHEFGMVEHPVISCLGASPDGIVTPYKNDGIHSTELIGRMLEIKVPFMRKILKTGELKGEICPIYYWDQVQLQLECCDLDECDFWQCTLCEYSNWDMFVEDTCKTEPFRSKTTSFEKGCLIQLLPTDKIVSRKHPDYLKVVHESAKFIHQPKIEMTPKECKIWYESELSKLSETNPNYSLDRIIYWYLKVSHCETIHRDKKWFDSVKHKYEEMWSYITFVRSEPKYKELFLNFVDSTKMGDRDYDIDPLRNKIIFTFIDRLKNKELSEKAYELINNNIDKLKNISRKEKLSHSLNKLYEDLNELLLLE